MPTQIKKANPAVRGDRIKSARMLAGYTRKAFANQFQIPAATIRAWEEPPVNRNGVTANGAKRLIKVFHQCGIYCTSEWLLDGRGPGPTIIERYRDKDPVEQVSWGEEEAILRDIESFKQNNLAPMVAVVSDSSMLPCYAYGDYVGGAKKTGEQIQSLVGLNCIVEVGAQVMVRRISMVGRQNRYTLTALNMEQSGAQPVITDVAIAAAAQVVWHRSRERSSFV